MVGESLGGPACAGPPDAGSWPTGFTIRQGAEGEHVLDELCRVARAKDAPPMDRAALGRLMQTFAGRDHAAEAASFRRYWLRGAGADRPLWDVVHEYRAWLRRQSGSA